MQKCLVKLTTNKDIRRKCLILNIFASIVIIIAHKHSHTNIFPIAIQRSSSFGFSSDKINFRDSTHANLREQMISILRKSDEVQVPLNGRSIFAQSTHPFGGKPKIFGHSTTRDDCSTDFSKVTSIKLGSISRIILRSSSIPTFT